jgi:two-component system phosphate regulon sensor histidine kinase PhoR
MNIIPYVELKKSKVNGVILTFVEITTRIKDLTDLEKLIAENGIILDTISHDIKTPLTNMILTLGVLKKLTSESSQKIQALLTTVDTSIKKMQSVIQDLTDIRRQEHRYKEDEELLSFEHILEDVRLTLAPNIKESEAIIQSEINLSEIFFSRRKLRSIIYNLINNAIKFRSEDTRPVISIKTEREDNFMVITIKDNGIGIDPDKQAKIFSKYFRAENVIEGSGIGLYLVKEIVTASGGKIELESKEGKGAQFKVYLKIE